MQNSTKISKFSTRCKILYTRIKKWWKCVNHKNISTYFPILPADECHISRLLRRPVFSLLSSLKLCLVWLVFWVFVPPDWLWLPPGRVWPALWSQSRPLRSCLHSVSALRAQPGQGRHQGNSGESRERHRMRYNETNRNNTTPRRDRREAPLSHNLLLQSQENVSDDCR